MRLYLILCGVVLSLVGNCVDTFADCQRSPNAPTLSSVASTAPCATPPVCELSSLPFISENLHLLLTSYNFHPTSPKQVAQGFRCSHTGYAAEGAGGVFNVTIDYVCDQLRGWQHSVHTVDASFISAPYSNPSVTISANEQVEYAADGINQVGSSVFQVQSKETASRRDLPADLESHGANMDIETTLSRETFAYRAYEQAPGKFELQQDVVKREQKLYANDILASDESLHRTSLNERSSFSSERVEYLPDGQLLESMVDVGLRVGIQEFSYLRVYKPFIHEVQTEALEIASSDDGVTEVAKNPLREVSSASLKGRELTVPLSKQDADNLSTYLVTQRQLEASWGFHSFPDFAL